MGPLARHLGLCVTASVVAASCSAASPGAPSASSVEVRAGRILVLGDSLAVTPSRSDNFPSLLQERLGSKAPGWAVVNAGVSGDTSAGGLARFDAAAKGGADLLILELGANDGLRGVAIATVERNLSTIIERAQARGMRILLCGMETPPSHGWDYTVAFHQLFPRLAARYGVPLVPFLLEGVALTPEMNGPDGFHPNAAGARRIAETVWPYLEPLLTTTAAKQSA